MTNLLAAAATKTRKVKTHADQVVAYVRVSTDEQKLSPQAQEDALREYAAKHGLNVLAIHRDVGVSGAADFAERPGLVAALDAVAQAKAGALLVLRMDRLARDTKKSSFVELLLERHGARLLTMDTAPAEDDPFAPMVRMMQSWMAQQERALISHRTKAALQQLSKQGKRVSRVAPYGYAFQDGALVEVEQEQRGLRVMLEMAQHMTQHAAVVRPAEIAATLTSMGFRSRTDKPFDRATVFRIVKRHLQSKEASR